MLNAIGLANVGVEAFIKAKMPFLRKISPAVFVNVAGMALGDYEEVIRKLEPVGGIDGYEVNISCPNVKKGGVNFSSSPMETKKITRALRRMTKRTLIVKLSPNVTDITSIARVCEDEGADAVSLINTLVGMAVDIFRKRPRLANIFGGLSGPAVRPVGVAMTYKVGQCVKIPVIGIGGIVSAADALEYIIAGASAVEIGTGNFVNPDTAVNVLEGIKRYMKERKTESIKELTGSICI
jgi:dihydroorotate dehydrogenase (NAD+) catalytic subunit